MSTQYRLVQSGKTASGGYSAGQGSSEPVAPRIYKLQCIIQNEFLSKMKLKQSPFTGLLKAKQK
jgi:hypothetical protein